jgi:hypothetical protein
MQLMLYFSIVVQGQSCFSNDSSNEDDLNVIIVIIILEVSEIAIYYCNPLAVGLHLVCWISFKPGGEINLFLLG